MYSQQHVELEVKKCAKWWFGQRKQKLVEQLNETMSVNPFLLPFLFDYHDLDGFEKLADLLMAAHLMTGHATGFGKLVDEKILPNVFKTKKLDSSFRRLNKPFSKSCFDEVDHLVLRSSGEKELLSLKAGKWTIQLTMAVQLNKAFHEIIENHGDSFSKIVVGVFYGKKESLTDKYDILRGINRGANHDVVDLTNQVNVWSGVEFWSWLNDGELRTQEWVLNGILSALKDERINAHSKDLLNKFRDGISRKYESSVNEDGTINWSSILTKING
jgi:hypothetical protein